MRLRGACFTALLIVSGQGLALDRFLSWSLPDRILIEEAEAAARHPGDRLVFRGFGGRDGPSRWKRLYALLRAGMEAQGPALSIDPEAFRREGITRVPAYRPEPPQHLLGGADYKVPMAAVMEEDPKKHLRDTLKRLGAAEIRTRLLGTPRSGSFRHRLPVARAPACFSHTPVSIAPRDLKLSAFARILKGDREKTLSPTLPEVHLIAFAGDSEAQVAAVQKRLSEPGASGIRLLAEGIAAQDQAVIGKLMQRLQGPVYLPDPLLLEQLGLKALPSEIEISKGRIEIRQWVP